MKIDDKAIRKLAELLDETGLSEIEVAEGEQMIRVNKGGMIMGGGQSFVPRMDSDPTVKHPANTDAPAAIGGETPGAVTSPMVGTVYLASEPGAAPFARKGDTVKAGDTLLIIEAMKVMNPIKAQKGGTVTHVMVENGQPVEFGDVLMVVE
jgi:acetyl-CoA carboxylase biotin carboxyl carrier protein